MTSASSATTRIQGMLATTRPSVLRFGRFEVRYTERQLLVDGQPAALGSRAFDLLVALLDHRERVVGKSELLDLVWPGLFVEENNLAVQISNLRKFLDHKMIVSVPGRGYRFAVAVDEDVGSSSSPASANPGQAPLPDATPPHNLPRELSLLVGRDVELTDTKALLGRSRLLTLVGTGGVGKTRLALALAALVVDRYPEGVWFVDLAPLADPSLVPDAVAGALGIAKTDGRPLMQSLCDFARPRRLLVLLDNCEHLLEACARFAEEFLRATAMTTLLATSREPLRLQGEQTYEVPTLSLPAPAAGLEEIERADAVRLFVTRARQQRPTFELTAANASAVVALCLHLDGIPLALELAAARVRLIAVEQIVEKLGDRFRVLTGGDRNAQPRHQTLRATVDWSYKLLDVHERGLLGRLSVFAGGWSLEAAEAVCAGHEGAPADVFDGLDSLVTKSLVISEERGGATRYRLLETIRLWAQEKLQQSSEEARCLQSHLSYFVALAESAEPELRGATQQNWLQRLETEHDNFRAALARACAGAVGDVDGGLRLAAALTVFWMVRGHLREGRTWFSRLLGAAPSGISASVRASALSGAAILAAHQGEFRVARELVEPALAIRRELGDLRSVATSLLNLASMAYQQGDESTARKCGEEAVAMFRELGVRPGIAKALMYLGEVAAGERRPGLQASLLEEALSILRELGDVRSIAITLNNLSNAAREQGDYSKARALLEESALIHRQLGNRQSIARSLQNFGTLDRLEGDLASAMGLYQESLSILSELGDRGTAGELFEQIAFLMVAMGKPLRAARLWGAAERLRESTGARLSLADGAERDGQLAVARAALANDDAFDHEWRAGRAMTFDSAVDFALQP